MRVFIENELDLKQVKIKIKYDAFHNVLINVKATAAQIVPQMLSYQ